MADVTPVDALIVGGGPAGAAAAIALGRAGRAVALIERSRYAAIRVGETLPPRARVLLGVLGVWERFLGDEHLASPGIVAAWGEPALRADDFLFDPHGDGWHIDRRRFDFMLADAASEAGAALHLETQVVACARHPEGGWAVETTNTEEHLRFRARVLVDATGRSPSQRLGTESPRRVYDHLVGVVGFFAPQRGPREADARTWIEACEHGWWYSARLPGGHLAAAWMTDADALAGARPEDLFDRALAGAPHTRGRLGAPLTTGLNVVAANSYLRERVAGDDWLVVGDAAAAWDPLSAQGILKAMESGLRAAESIERALRADGAAPLAAHAAYVDWVERDFAAYLRERAEHYGRERRFPHAPFWRRRQSLG